MQLVLKRERSLGSSTAGKLYVDGVFECYTLEDVIRAGKIPGKTAISFGKYKVIIDMSNRFKRLLPLLLDVPNFAGVRIHPGNTSEDTEGCILVGTTVNNLPSGAVIGSSRIAFNKLFKKMQAAKKPITLEIVYA
jgi:hypothetical protein